MTVLRDKTKSFETGAMERGLPVVVELHRYQAAVRLKGKRTRYLVPYDVIYWMGVKIEAEAARVAKKQASKK